MRVERRLHVGPRTLFWLARSKNNINFPPRDGLAEPKFALAVKGAERIECAKEAWPAASDQSRALLQPARRQPAAAVGVGAKLGPAFASAAVAAPRA